MYAYSTTHLLLGHAPELTAQADGLADMDRIDWASS